MTREAVNHAGWEVQVLTKSGWEAIPNFSKLTRKDADELLELFILISKPEMEFRVYESLS